MLFIYTNKVCYLFYRSFNSVWYIFIDSLTKYDIDLWLFDYIWPFCHVFDDFMYFNIHDYTCQWIFKLKNE